MNKKSPKIRFKGFTDDWEQRKLGETVDYIIDNRGKNPKSYTEDGIPVIDNFMIQNNRYPNLNKTNRFIDAKTYNYFIRKYIEENDILVTLVGNGIGNIALAPKTLSVIIQNTLGFRFSNYDYNFMYYSLLFESPQIKKLDRGMAQPSIRQDELLSIDLNIPEFEEQQKIGQFFKKIDDTIALHQDAIQRQQDLKKALLQKLFPVNGERIPTVRFANFKEKWEQRKLNSIVERITRKNKNLESNLPLTISAQYGLVDQSTFFKKQVASKDVSGYFLVKKGEFAYNKSYSSGYPWGAIKRLDNYDKGVLSTLYIVFKPKKIESDFLMSYYDTNFWHKEVSVRAAEGARNHGLLNISAQDFFETELIIPIKPEEQSKIGAFFKQLDETITLHQQALDKLNLLKQSLLQKMFV